MLYLFKAEDWQKRNIPFLSLVGQEQGKNYPEVSKVMHYKYASWTLYLKCKDLKIKWESSEWNVKNKPARILKLLLLSLLKYNKVRRVQKENSPKVLA